MLVYSAVCKRNRTQTHHTASCQEEGAIATTRFNGKYSICEKILSKNAKL